MVELSRSARVALPVAPVRAGAFPLDAVALEDEYLEYARALDGDAASRSRADAVLVDAGALYHGGPIQWAFVPKVFSGRDIAYLAWIAETMGRIMDKVTRAFVADPRVRAAFALDPAIERLATMPNAFATEIPIARVDIFLDEETGSFKFCELNTDGSSGMLVTEGATRANLVTETSARFAGRHRVSTFDILGSCADAVLACYREAGGVAKRPRVVAVDYAESIVAEEIEAFRPVIAARGAELSFSDIRDLRYADGVLADATGPIDCVWRRVVISEMLGKPCPGADALMACAAEGRVPIVGGFRTWPCATKTVFAFLHGPLASELLDEDELAFVRAHVPATYLLDAASDLARFSDRERWIAKPRDGYNSVGVRAGRDCDEDTWRGVLEEMAATGGTVQEYVVPYASPNFEGGAGVGAHEPVPYMNMEGLYLFNGRFAGVFTRCGRSSVIGEFTGRLNMGCLVVE